jgi:hypothetical protein
LVLACSTIDCIVRFYLETIPLDGYGKLCLGIGPRETVMCRSPVYGKTERRHSLHRCLRVREDPPLWTTSMMVGEDLLHCEQDAECE